MHSTERRLPSIVIGLALALAANGASAIGWLRAQQAAVLGQPLDFSAALRLDPGDSVAPECINADVTIGDQRVQPGGVRVLVDNSAADAVVMRVLTVQAVDEPVVSVTLGIGCPERMSRRFVVLADPPLLVAAAPVAAAADPAPRGDSRQPAAGPDRASTARSEAAAQTAAQRDEAVRRSAAAREAARERRREQRRQAAATLAAATVAAPAAAAPPPPPEAAAAPAPRLRLDASDVSATTRQPTLDSETADVVAQAIEVVAQAASAARTSAAAAAAAEERVAALERTVAQMRAESQASRELAAQSRALRDDGMQRWLPLLMLALLVLALVVGWLAWRVRGLQRERQLAWQRAAARRDSMLPPEGLALPIVTTEVPAALPRAASGAAPPSPATAPATLQPLPPEDTGAPTAVERTELLPPRPAFDRDGGQPRDVSIEELLDLEQQAEFFIVLGQDDAAIELLVEHLRSTGGGSPLPYLKLLETYRRRDERDAYERTRARFNHRFNAYAPDWDTDLTHGRSLEDYPGVLPRLQQVWPRPLDAMAELEALLFRKSRGELFELPAYREVLFLYSLARDLLDREAAVTGTVDVLLPLSDGGEFSATSPHPYFGLERDSVFDGMAMEDRPTQPVDLDLTQPETRPMIEMPPGRE